MRITINERNTPLSRSESPVHCSLTHRQSRHAAGNLVRGGPGYGDSCIVSIRLLWYLSLRLLIGNTDHVCSTQTCDSIPTIKTDLMLCLCRDSRTSGRSIENSVFGFASFNGFSSLGIELKPISDTVCPSALGFCSVAYTGMPRI